MDNLYLTIFGLLQILFMPALVFLVVVLMVADFILEPEYLAACCGDEWFTEELSRRDTPQFTAE